MVANFIVFVVGPACANNLTVKLTFLVQSLLVQMKHDKTSHSGLQARYFISSSSEDVLQDPFNLVTASAEIPNRISLFLQD